MAVQQNKKIGVFPIDYTKKAFTLIPNKEIFFKSNKFPEYQNLRVLFNTIKTVFHLPDDKVTIGVANNERIYRFNLLTPDVKKAIFGYIVIIPTEQRLDIWSDNNLLLQYKSKRIMYKGYSYLLDRLQLDSMFEKIISASY